MDAIHYYRARRTLSDAGEAHALGQGVEFGKVRGGAGTHAEHRAAVHGRFRDRNAGNSRLARRRVASASALSRLPKAPAWA